MDPRREGDVHGDLRAGAGDLAVALGGVAVAEVEEGPFDEDRQVDRHSLAEATVVHVAAVRARRGAGDGLPARRGDAEAAEHRIERDREATEGRLRLGQRRRPALDVDLPVTAAPLARELLNE